MGHRRLQNAADAAGYSMVNPDDFAGEAAPEPQQAIANSAPHSTPTVKSWFNWDYSWLTGGKATA